MLVRSRSMQRGLAVLLAIAASARVASARADAAADQPPTLELPTITPPPPPEAEPEPVPEPTPAARPALSPEQKLAIRQACERHEPACDPVALLGSLERAALVRALAARGLTIEPAPWGKPLGKIHVVTQQVFADSDGLLDLLNVFHVTTRERVIERLVVLRPGDTWSQAAVDETARALRDPVTTSLAVVVPVRSESDGKVDLLAVTRDLWSLRLNSSYRFEDGTFTFWSLSLSENNFFGSHALAAAVLSVDLGTVGVGPLLMKNNIAGRHIDARLRAQLLLNREALQQRGEFVSDGSSSEIDVSRPLWKLDSRWGAGISWRHRFSVVRQYEGTSLRTYDAPETAGDDMIEREYRMRVIDMTPTVVHGFGGDAWKHRLTLGYTLETARPRVVDDFAGSPEVEAAFVRDVLPRSERNSVLFLTYNLFEPRYREFRNISTYDLAEDLRLGATLSATAGVGLRALGSEADFVRGSLTAGHVVPLGPDGTLSASVTVAGRRQGGDFIDMSATTLARAVSPTFGWFRLVGEWRTSALIRETQNRFLTIGGDNGLRGFGINQFIGQRRWVARVELRTLPAKLKFLRLGAVGFYDAGGAADRYADLPYHHDVGVGVRLLVPQIAAELMRFDLALPLDGGGGPRFIGGFESEF
jgi:hypothetical protein